MSYLSKSRVNNLKNHISWIQNEIKRLSLKLSDEKNKQKTNEKKKSDRKYDPLLYITKERKCFVERVDKRKNCQIISVYFKIVDNFRYDLRKLQVENLSENLLSKIEINIGLLQKEIWSYHGKVPVLSIQQEDDMMEIKEIFTDKVVTRFNKLRFKWDNLRKVQEQRKEEAKRKEEKRKKDKSGKRSRNGVEKEKKPAKKEEKKKEKKNVKLKEEKKKKSSLLPSSRGEYYDVSLQSASDEYSDAEDTHHRHKRKKRRRKSHRH